jgi:LysM domain
VPPGQRPDSGSATLAREVVGTRPAAGTGQVVGTRQAVGTRQTPGAAGTATVRPVPLRLTRRGRIVVGFAAAVLATLALTIGSMALSGAQAANHGRAGAGYQGMRQIVVQPGQTLWSIASTAEPSADPRQVVAEIMSVNALTGSSLQAGELLWVPK